MEATCADELAVFNGGDWRAFECRLIQQLHITDTFLTVFDRQTIFNEIKDNKMGKN